MPPTLKTSSSYISYTAKMNTCQICYQPVQCLHCSQPLPSCAHCPITFGGINVVCQHCYVDNTSFYYPVCQSYNMTITLPVPQAGQVLTFGNSGNVTYVNPSQPQ